MCFLVFVQTFDISGATKNTDIHISEDPHLRSTCARLDHLAGCGESLKKIAAQHRRVRRVALEISGDCGKEMGWEPNVCVKILEICLRCLRQPNLFGLFGTWDI